MVRLLGRLAYRYRFQLINVKQPHMSYDEYDECDAPLPELVDDDDSDEELLPDEDDDG